MKRIATSVLLLDADLPQVKQRTHERGAQETPVPQR
jgi:hypothetical protein